MRYAVIIEKDKRNCSAYIPDVPGCVAAGKSVEETKNLMKEALEFHVEGMLLDGERFPESTSESCYVSVDVNKILKKVRKQSQAAPAGSRRRVS